MRIADGPAYVRSLGYATDLLDSDNFLSLPMHHGGVHVGSFLLAAQEGAPQFSDEDADMLELFAAQAAAAVANTRTAPAQTSRPWLRPLRSAAWPQNSRTECRPPPPENIRADMRDLDAVGEPLPASSRRLEERHVRDTPERIETRPLRIRQAKVAA